jgi:hypothetical protein
LSVSDMERLMMAEARICRAREVLA